MCFLESTSVRELCRGGKISPTLREACLHLLIIEANPELYLNVAGGSFQQSVTYVFVGIAPTLVIDLDAFAQPLESRIVCN